MMKQKIGQVIHGLVDGNPAVMWLVVSCHLRQRDSAADVGNVQRHVVQVRMSLGRWSSMAATCHKMTRSKREREREREREGKLVEKKLPRVKKIIPDSGLIGSLDNLILTNKDSAWSARILSISFFTSIALT